jgi:tRNA A-37 threonylcarbamoyl transferase component Bud32
MADKENISHLKALMDKYVSEELSDQKILSQIKKLLFELDEGEEKVLNSELVKFSDYLFRAGIQIEGINLNALINGSQTQTKQQVEEEISDKKTQEAVSKISFRGLYEQLCHGINIEVGNLKGYSIVKLENEPANEYQLVIVKDENYDVDSLKSKLQSYIGENEITCYDFSGFREVIIQGGSEDNNFICLFLMTSKANNKEGLDAKTRALKDIIAAFPTFESHIVNEKLDNHKKITNPNDFISEIGFVTGKFLTNARMTFEEEKVIKKLFKSFTTPLLDYKLLKAGNSGANVVEVQPATVVSSIYEGKKFIVKYSPLSDENKLEKEAKNFHDNIWQFKGIEGYSCEYATTLLYEGIRYDYAISDGVEKSYSFAQVIDLDEEVNPFYLEKETKLQDLFKDDVFDHWKATLEQIEISVKELYINYLKEDKLYKKIQEILPEKQDIELIDKIKRILDYKIKTNLKVCHGDLHTENFFVDSKNVYLIDFGFTGKQHAVIDHGALEASIKFKHFPWYLENFEYEEIEKELMLDDTFLASYKFNSTKREVLIELLKLVNVCRNEAVKYHHDSASTLEYLLSLFVLTLRQIPYPDMNQRYAIVSARVLADKILTVIG